LSLVWFLGFLGFLVWVFGLGFWFGFLVWVLTNLSTMFDWLGGFWRV